MTSSLSTTSKVSIGAVLLAGAGAQLVDDAAFAVIPPLAVLGPIAGLIAIALTALAARAVTRNKQGAAVARTGLAVGAVSAATGLLVGGFGLIGLVLAVITMVAGVAGAVVGRQKQAIG
jgi:hypothetical protein